MPPALLDAEKTAQISGASYPGFEGDLVVVRSHFKTGKVRLGLFRAKRISKQIENLSADMPEDLSEKWHRLELKKRTTQAKKKTTTY